MESKNSEISKIQLLLEETMDLINDAESIEDASATLVNAKVSVSFKYQIVFIFDLHHCIVVNKSINK